MCRETTLPVSISRKIGWTKLSAGGLAGQRATVLTPHSMRLWSDAFGARTRIRRLEHRPFRFLAVEQNRGGIGEPLAKSQVAVFPDHVGIVGRIV